MMRQIKKTPILNTIIALSLMLAGAGLVNSTAQAAPAADSIFSQVIRDLDCSHTTYDKAVGQVNEVECDIFAPKHERTDIAPSGYPILYGVYDAVHAVTNPATSAHDLVIEVAGRRFVLGVDPELRVNGNAWVLDLSNWPNDHGSGAAPVLERGQTYPGGVSSLLQAHGTAQQTRLTANFSITIPLKEPAPQPGSIAIVVQSVGKTLAATGVSLWLIVLAALGLIAIAIFILLRHKKGAANE